MQRLCIVLWLLCVGPLAAAADCANLVEGYDTTAVDYQGQSRRVLDFSRFLASEGLVKRVGFHDLLSLKSIFKDYKQETLITFNPDGHVSVTVNGQRFDARLGYVRQITLRDTRTMESGVMIRLEPGSPERAKLLIESMQALAGKKSLTCVAGTCTMAQEAGFAVPEFISPSSFFHHILTEGLKWRGERVEYDIIATQNIGDLNRYLGTLKQAPLTLTWQFLQGARIKGKRLTQGAVAFVQRNVVNPIAGFFFYTGTTPEKLIEQPKLQPAKKETGAIRAPAFPVLSRVSGY